MTETCQHEPQKVQAIELELLRREQERRTQEFFDRLEQQRQSEEWRRQVAAALAYVI